MFITLKQTDRTLIAVNTEHVVAFEERVNDSQVVGSIVNFTNGERLIVLDTVHEIPANITEGRS